MNKYTNGDVLENEGCGVLQQSGQCSDQGPELEGKKDESADSFEVGTFSVGEQLIHGMVSLGR